MSRLTIRLFRVMLRLRSASSSLRRQEEESVRLLERLLAQARDEGRVRAFVVGISALLDALAGLLADRIRGAAAVLFAGLGHDLRHALRAIRLRPGAAAATIATLALGIGLNAAVFSIVDWVLLRPLPFPAPSQLVRISSADAAAPAASGDVAYSEFDALSRATAFGSAAAVSVATRVIASPGRDPAHLVIGRVSGDLFATLGAPPQIGRGFDARQSAWEPIVVIGDRLWRERFAADPSIVGRSIAIDAVPHTIVGVMGPALGYPANVDLWRPVASDEREDDDRESAMIARLNAGVTAERARHELAALAAEREGARRISIEPLQRSEVGDVRLALIVLAASSALILLIAGVNVAMLARARGLERTGEMAVRAALGASRSRLARHVAVETLLTTAFGGAAGLLLGEWTLEYLVSLAPIGLPRANEIVLDGRILLAGGALTLIAGLAAGVQASIRASRPDVQVCFGSTTAGRVTRRTSARTLVAVQAALAIVLSVAAVLLGRSLQHLVRQDDGFAADRLVAVDLYLRGAGATDERELFRRLVAAAESTPRVQSAAVALLLPTRTIGPRIGVSVRGAPSGSADRPKAILRPVTAGFFATAGIPIVDGRAFDGRDTRASPLVAIVNRAFVRDVMHGRGAVASVLLREDGDPPLTIVGVAGDITPAGEPERPAVYVVSEQVRAAGGYLIVRADVPSAVIASLAQRLGDVAPSLARDRIYPVADELARGRAVTRFSTQMASGFALVALALAAVGVYGLAAGELAARRRDFAIRLALGGTPRRTFGSVMHPILVTIACGTAAGLAAAVAAAHGMRALLHGVGPADPSTFLAAPALFAAVCAAAAGLAAARSRRASPIDLLRQG